MSENAIDANEIENWLTTQSDFSLKMEVYFHLESLGFNPFHGSTYFDHVTNKPRLHDIICYKVKDEKNIRLAIDCKGITPKYPLVISREPRTPNISHHDYFYTGKEPKENQPLNIEIGQIRDSLIYPINAPVGRTLNQIKKNNEGSPFTNDNRFYEKWSQSIFSAIELYKIIKFESYSAIFPILVVSNNSLWTVDYDNFEMRNPVVKKSNDVDFFIGYEFSQDDQRYTFSHLKILTLKGFMDFTDKIAREESFWNRVFPRSIFE